MTSPTTLKPHHGVLKGKGTALVGVAVEASGFVGAERLQHRVPDRAVRIMAIHATHGVLGYFVVKRSLKLRPHIQMAALAQLVYRRGFPNYQPVGSVGVDLVARRAGYLILGMAALQPSNLGGLIQVAGEADLVIGDGGQLCGIANVRRRCGFGMLGSRTMAGFTSSTLPATFLVRLHQIVLTFCKGRRDIFVTSGARVGARVSRRQRSRSRAAESRRQKQH